MTNFRALIVCSLALAACTRAPDPTPAPQAATTPAATATKVSVTPWSLPVDRGAAQPDLVRTPDGALLLSWIEPLAKGHALRLARYADGTWGAPRTIAQGDDWFVNWADTPHVQATADGALWAHWLRRSAAAPYAYDVVLSRSTDGGARWSTPTPVNEDGTPTEHGFVSLWAASDTSIGIAWLDGRHTGDGAHDAAAGHGGAMTLRTAMFDAQLQRSAETELDASTCDCCQTDVAMTPRGALVVYRDRTPAEIRDIAVTRLEAGAWTPPRMVHADGWRMPACPVNGPAMAAHADRVVVGWYTEAGGLPMVRVATSEDAGDRFGAPRDIARGAQVLGRVALAWSGDAAWISWLQETDDVQSLWVARIPIDAAQPHTPVRVATLVGRGRGTGVPQLVASGSKLHVAWTDVEAGAPRLRGAVIAMAAAP